METALLQFAISSAIIIVAGIALAKTADAIAEYTGLGRVLVGSLLLAGATSLPELAVDIHAVRMGEPNLAVGDLLGSSLFNILILALTDSFFRHPRRAFSKEFAHHTQSAVLSLNLTALVGIGIVSRFSSFTVGGIGFFSWIVFFVYLIGARFIFVHESDKDALPFSKRLRDPSNRKALVRSLLGFGAAASVILIAAPYLVDAADKIATETGLGHTFVGTTLIALSTSLPELVATVAAFRIGAPDLALGNIFGSNTFNMLLLFPLDAFYDGDLFLAVQPAHALTAFGVIAVSSIAVLGQLSRKREKTRIWEPSSELIVILTLAFLFLLYKTT